MKAMDNIKKDFTLMAILLIPAAIGINIVGGQLAAVLRLPIFLDAIGTILIAVIAGPWVGAVAGMLSNLVNGVIDPGFLPFTIVSMTTGFTAGMLAKKGMYTNIWKSCISVVIVAIATSIVAAPVVALVFGGVTGSGSTFITAFLLTAGQNLLQSVFTSQIIADLIDKFISIFIAYAIVRAMPARYLTKFSCGEQYIKVKN